MGRATHTFNTFPKRQELMNKGLIWTIVGILLVVALIIWIARAV